MPGLRHGVPCAAMPAQARGQSVEFGTPERVEFHLLNWARYMRTGKEVVGHRKSIPGLSNGGASKHFEDMLDDVDLACAKVVDAIIEGLSPVEQAALHNAYLWAVFRGTRTDLNMALGRAKAQVGFQLAKRGVW